MSEDASDCFGTLDGRDEAQPCLAATAGARSYGVGEPMVAWAKKGLDVGCRQDFQAYNLQQSPPSINSRICPCSKINEKVGRDVALNLATCFDGLRSDERDVVDQYTAARIAALRNIRDKHYWVLQFDDIIHDFPIDRTSEVGIGRVVGKRVFAFIPKTQKLLGWDLSGGCPTFPEMSYEIRAVGDSVLPERLICREPAQLFIAPFGRDSDTFGN